jgi:hypothetical protein
MTVTITRLYNDYSSASQAVRDLEGAGVPTKDISLVASNADNWYSKGGNPRTGTTNPAQNPAQAEHAATGAGTGAEIGTAVGGTAGLLTGLGLLAIPGVGPVVAAGWLVATAVGAVAGAAAGGLLGGLTGAGVSQSDAHVYAEGVRRGGSLVTARVSEADKSRVEAILDRHKAINVGQRGQAYRSAGWKTFDERAPAYTPDQVKKDRDLYRDVA